jgi:cephalosporin hydroxylase
MKLLIDTAQKTLAHQSSEGNPKVVDLYSKEAYEILSDLWLKTSWNQKYPYTFTWMGRPVIQHPEDMIRLQEVIYTLKPDVVIETGVAHGGSVVYTASLLKAMGKGRVVGVDIEIRPHNRSAIEKHELASYIQLVEGDSVGDTVVAEATKGIRPNDVVLIILDSNHSKAHVLSELETYYPFVSVGSYIVATDGLMQDLYDVPRGQAAWREDNPVMAVKAFVAKHPEFVVEQPAWQFNESDLDKNITGWPSAWIRRTS